LDITQNLDVHPKKLDINAKTIPSRQRKLQEEMGCLYKEAM
jgi:hypothetical protein